MHGYPTLQLVGLCDSLVCLYVLKKCCQCLYQNTSNRVKAEPVAVPVWRLLSSACGGDGGRSSGSVDV